ncbi:MAG: ABC transporter ATP-binding protein, partial [Spirochaetales bacterium]|nr:ABC transporter ATP-binding protein [Spirochaetales bacterium]
EYRKSRAINSRITGSFNENISGIRVVKALVRESRNSEAFSRLNDDMFSASYRAAWLSSMFLPVVQLLTSLGLAIILWYGILPSTIGRFTIGSLQAFIGYIGFMMWPIQNIANVYASMQNSIAGGERVFSLLDTQPSIHNSSAPLALKRFHGGIEFRGVHFSYETGKPVLSDFNLKVEPGQKVALVGPTGGGKSTIVNLVCRFYEPVSGSILWDGTDYTRYDLISVYSRLGVVLQTPHLFSGTIRENIRYGRLTANDEEVENASRLAHAHDFISCLENTYDEEVGEGGSYLSTGQKQLISIARAILARPDLIILDEATSSIDTLTEHLIQQGLDTLLAGSTSFIIAHRLSTIKDADIILYIDQGRITESGTHGELLRMRGAYYALYTNQFRTDREKELGIDTGL